MPKVRTRRFIACLLILVCAFPAWADDDRLANAVKAAYLCKLAEFVTWPESATPSDAFTLCVIGNSPFGNLIDRAVEGQTVQHHPVLLRRYPTIANNPGCQMMFVAGSSAQPAAAVLATVDSSPVLTVTDAQGDPDATGIVNFVLVDGHVRFEIKRQAATASGLVISSKLLSLAVQPREGTVQ
jgi:hypothetical protein